MALSRDHLEAMVWPKYREAVGELCQAVWALANPKQAAVPSPGWFSEIVEVQAKSLLLLIFSTPQAWIVFPEPIPGYSAVVYKKPRGAGAQSPQQRLGLRNHSFDQFSELAQLVERALVKVVKKAISAGSGDVVELENEDGRLFVFPRAKLDRYLMALGFSEEQIPRLVSLADIEPDA